MRTRTKNLLKRDEKIKDRFFELSEEKHGKHKLYTNDAIISMIADEFYLSEFTIEKIVFNRTNYK